ncbi:transglycosylase domain-containing protein [bacterium]|nr:transglycosylase domain-containing protein [bacterium]
MTKLKEKEADWQQYYPASKFTDRDILLKEYENCAANIQSQERIFLNAANFILVISAMLGSIAVSFLHNPTKFFNGALSTQTLLILTFIICSFSWLTVRYFAERQKSIIFDSRKIVILRHMLGLYYGTQHLVLPNWRIEGATNPFAIKLFPGWFSYVTYPFWLICVTSTILLYGILPHIIKNFVSLSSIMSSPSNQITFAAIFLMLWVIVISFSFRFALYDTNERLVLSLAKRLASCFHLGLVKDFEYVIYRAKLAVYETQRMKIDLTVFKKNLIFIEDRGFYKHKGISIKAIARAILGIIGKKRRSGGSTITQQLVRTLFIKEMNKTFRRKIVEIILALWFEKVCSKEEILEIYLSSVRFENRVNGITEALKYFFQWSKGKSISEPEIFFLIERISNVRSLILTNKISDTLYQMFEKRLLTSEDISEIKAIYSKMYQSKKLKVENKEIFEKWLGYKLIE